MDYTVFIREERNIKVHVAAENENEAISKAYIMNDMGFAEPISYSSHVVAEVDRDKHRQNRPEYADIDLAEYELEEEYEYDF